MQHMLMTRIWTAALTCLITSCGAFPKEDQSEENSEQSSDAAPPFTGGSPGQTGPRGADGADGINGTDGKDGLPGPKGDQGEDGLTGRMGGIVLYDALDRQIGAKFSEENNGVAHVILFDHQQAKIDRYSGALVAPSSDIFCMHLTSDCSGACYVYDRKWLDFVVRNADGQLFVASRETTNGGSIEIQSYVDGNGICQAAAITTIESYLATAYTPATVSFPLNAPLYWDLAN